MVSVRNVARAVVNAESTMRRAVEYRKVQAEFHARGQASWEEYQRTGISFSAEEGLTRLREMTSARREQLKARELKAQ